MDFIAYVESSLQCCIATEQDSAPTNSATKKKKKSSVVVRCSHDILSGLTDGTLAHFAD